MYKRQTFGNVVAVFLLALAVGAALVAVLMRRAKPDAILFWCSLAAAVSCCLCLALFVNITRLQYFVLGETFVVHLLRGFALVLAYVMLPVTTQREAHSKGNRALAVRV